MKIWHLEKIYGRNMLILGRKSNVDAVINALRNRDTLTVTSVPDIDTYYADFPDHVKQLSASLADGKSHVITTQNEEYIDAMLESNMDFTVTTVRDFDGELRVRCLSKEDAKNGRETYNMELR